MQSGLQIFHRTIGKKNHSFVKDTRNKIGCYGILKMFFLNNTSGISNKTNILKL